MGKDRKPPRRILRPLKPPGVCIFCGRGGLTKEHVWADWLGKDLLPRDDDLHKHITTRVTYDKVSDNLNVVYNQKIIQGDMGSRKLRIVCAECNHGWMSRLQEEAKPILSSLISGDMRPFLPGESEGLASWLTMMTIIYEYCDKDTIAVTEQERRQFKQTVRPLPGWMISIGRYSGERWGPKRVHHRGIRLVRADETAALTSPMGCNSQSTTIIAGKMIALLLSFSDMKLLGGVGIRMHPHMMAIHPGNGLSLDLRDKGTLGDDEAEGLVDAIIA